jgi:hypothetical protein
VRVLQVIIQDPNRMTGSPAFCRMWQQRYNLSNRMLVDPVGSVRRFASGSLPGAIILDSTGRIRYIGRAASLSAIRYQIDSILDGVAP